MTDVVLLAGASGRAIVAHGCGPAHGSGALVHGGGVRLSCVWSQRTRVLTARHWTDDGVLREAGHLRLWKMGNLLEVSDLFVAPEIRGRGVGRAMLAALETEWRARWPGTRLTRGSIGA